MNTRLGLPSQGSVSLPVPRPYAQPSTHRSRHLQHPQPLGQQPRGREQRQAPLLHARGGPRARRVARARRARTARRLRHRARRCARADVARDRRLRAAGAAGRDRPQRLARLDGAAAGRGAQAHGVLRGRVLGARVGGEGDAGRERVPHAEVGGEEAESGVDVLVGGGLQAAVALAGAGVRGRQVEHAPRDGGREGPEVQGQVRQRRRVAGEGPARRRVVRAFHQGPVVVGGGLVRGGGGAARVEQHVYAAGAERLAAGREGNVVGAPVAGGVVDGDLGQVARVQRLVDEAEGDAGRLVGAEVAGEDLLVELADDGVHEGGRARLAAVGRLDGVLVRPAQAEGAVVRGRDDVRAVDVGGHAEGEAGRGGAADVDGVAADRARRAQLTVVVADVEGDAVGLLKGRAFARIVDVVGAKVGLLHVLGEKRANDPAAGKACQLRATDRMWGDRMGKIAWARSHRHTNASRKTHKSAEPVSICTSIFCPPMFTAVTQSWPP